MSRAELKLQAKYLLKGRYTQAILICLIPTLLSIGITYTGFLASTVYAMIHSSLLQNRSLILYYLILWIFLIYLQVALLINQFYLLTAIFWTFINLSRGKKTQISLINDGFQTISRKHLIPLFCLYNLRGIFLLGWSLLLIIPGIIKGYAYSQAEFVYYDLYEKTGERPIYLNA